VFFIFDKLPYLSPIYAKMPPITVAGKKRGDMTLRVSNSGQNQTIILGEGKRPVRSLMGDL
jgi:hypothetical protein